MHSVVGSLLDYKTLLLKLSKLIFIHEVVPYAFHLSVSDGAGCVACYAFKSKMGIILYSSVYCIFAR